MKKLSIALLLGLAVSGARIANGDEYFKGDSQESNWVGNGWGGGVVASRTVDTGFRISKVEVFRNHDKYDVVSGMRIWQKDKDGNEKDLETIGVIPPGAQPETLILQPGEYIQTITLCVGKWVDAMKFTVSYVDASGNRTTRDTNWLGGTYHDGTDGEGEHQYPTLTAGDGRMVVGFKANPTRRDFNQIKVITAPTNP